MTFTRNSIFSSEPTASLYEAACTTIGCKLMGTVEMLQILANSFDVPPETLTDSNLLAESVLKHAVSIKDRHCTAISERTRVSRHASWHAEDMFYCDALVIRYPGSTPLQRQHLADAYNQHYGQMADTYEALYKDGYARDAMDGIFLNKALFCKFVLKNLVDEYQLTEKERVGASVSI